MNYYVEFLILIAVLGVPIGTGLFLKWRYERKHGPIR